MDEQTIQEPTPATEPTPAAPPTTQEPTLPQATSSTTAGPNLTPNVPKPAMCRIIVFTNAEGTIGPAIITQVEHVAAADSTPAIVRMNLCMFDPVMGPRNYYVQDAAGALRMSPGEPETWNWPVRD